MKYCVISLWVPAKSILIYDQNFYFKIRREHQKNSYERRAYESVDVRSLFWVIPDRSTETSNPGLKGILQAELVSCIF